MTFRQKPLMLAASTLSILCLTSVAIAQTPAGSNCTTDSCYAAFNKSPVDFNTNRADCQARGGDLADIADSVENAAVLAAADTCQASAAGYPEALIGLNDIAANTQYVWADGTPAAYTNWMPGQPDHNPNENWGEIRGSASPTPGQWNDTGSGSPYPPKCYVCEFGVQWHAAAGGSGSVPGNSFNSSGDFVCQHIAPGTGEMIPGRVTPGGCGMAKEGPSGSGNAYGHYVSGYNVLLDISGSAGFAWQAWAGTAPTNAVIGGTIAAGGHRYICRSPSLGIGSTTPQGTCKIRNLPVKAKPKVHTVSSFEILVLAP